MYSLFLSDFNEIWVFSSDFRKNTQISNLMKVRPVGDEVFHVEGRTDMTKIVVDKLGRGGYVKTQLSLYPIY